MINFHKIPMSQQSLKIDDLVTILTEDLPNCDKTSLEDRLMKTLAISLTEQKLPVLDILKEHAMQENSSMIEHHTFAANVIENAFHMKDKFTRNMIALLVAKYDDRQSEGFDYGIFMSDLEALESVNPTTIRIFKTQTEINFFQQGLDEGGADGS